MKIDDLLVFLFFLLALPQAAFAKDPVKLVRVVSVDWEGEEINPRDIQAIKEFRAKFPEVKLVHFFNAAYYTAPGADREKINRLVREVILPQDELGLHIHGWQDLFEHAFEAKGLAGSRVLSSQAWEDNRRFNGRVGHDIPIEQYAVQELEAVIAFSIETLRANGFQQPIVSFRAGGWQAGPKVLRAIENLGFTIDSSAVSPQFLVGLPSSELSQKVADLWGERGINGVSVQAGSGAFMLPGRKLLEMPSALFADYASDHNIRPYIEALLRNNDNGNFPRVVHLAFHAETAWAKLDHLIGMLQLLQKDYVDKGLVKVTDETLASLGAGPARGTRSERAAWSCRALF